MSDKYSALVDKITDDEIVVDFVERLKIGKDFVIKPNGSRHNYITDGSTAPDGSNTLFKADTYLLDIINKIFTFLPDSLIANLDKLIIVKMKINTTDKEFSTTFVRSGGDNPSMYSVYRAYSEITGMDFSSWFAEDGQISTISGDTANMRVSVRSDAKFMNEDIITLYVMKK